MQLTIYLKYGQIEKFLGVLTTIIIWILWCFFEICLNIITKLEEDYFV